MGAILDLCCLSDKKKFSDVPCHSFYKIIGLGKKELVGCGFAIAKVECFDFLVLGHLSKGWLCKYHSYVLYVNWLPPSAVDR